MQVRVTTTAIPASVDTQTESIGSSWRSRNGFHLYLFLFHLPVTMAFFAYIHSDRCISGNAAPFGQLTLQTFDVKKWIGKDCKTLVYTIYVKYSTDGPKINMGLGGQHFMPFCC